MSTQPSIPPGRLIEYQPHKSDADVTTTVWACSLGDIVDRGHFQLRSSPNSVTQVSFHRKGALKMKDRKMKDRLTWVENAGPNN